MKLLLLGGAGSTLAMVVFGGFVLVSILSLFGGTQMTETQTVYGTGDSYTAVVPKGSGATAGQEEFAGALVACAGLNPNVALAWTVAEGGGVNDGQPANNFLFLTAVGGGFRTFASPEESAQAVCLTLSFPDYAGIAAAVGQAPVLQLIAIAESPWDGGHVAWGDPAGHYGGDGRNLVNAYYSLLGNTSCSSRVQPC